MKAVFIVLLLVMVLMVPTIAVAQSGDVNVDIGIVGDNPNVGIGIVGDSPVIGVFSGGQSIYGIYSGLDSKFYINGTDLNDMFTKSNGTSQFGPPPPGAFTQQNLSLPMPPAPPLPTTMVAGATAANYDTEIQELYDISNNASQEREILADALVKTVTIIDELKGELDTIYAASTLTIEPEAPAVSPEELTIEEMLEMQAFEIAKLKIRLLINDIVTLLLLIGAIAALIRYRLSIFGTGVAVNGKTRQTEIA